MKTLIDCVEMGQSGEEDALAVITSAVEEFEEEVLLYPLHSTIDRHLSFFVVAERRDMGRLVERERKLHFSCGGERAR